MNMKTQLTENKDQGTVSIAGTLAWDDFAPLEKTALKNLGEKVEIDGFRKGNVPADILKQKVGDMALLEEMASLALVHAYPDALREHTIDAIGRPDVALTKIARGEDLGFTITTAVMPKITLKDYKKIADDVMKKQNKAEVTDEELEHSLMQLRKMRKQSELAKEADDPKNVPSIKDIDEKDVPELDEAYVKELGDFESIEDFKNKLKANMLQEKEQQALEKQRVEIVEALIEKSDAVIPDILANFELEKLMMQMEHDISMSGMSFDDYLKAINKTKEEVTTEMMPEAQKRSHMQLLINYIADQENIEADAKKVEEEMEKIKAMYQDMKEFDEDRARAYVEGMLINQGVFEFLEGKK
ncbi:hypothetical protein H6776_00275 [Candidatus Nomurabacteria bacterium]|nr:hypothetical protein [Candidatus Nomurabacteria bacterium]